MSALAPPSNRKELAQALERAGFSILRTRGSHQFLQHPDGRATVRPLRTRTLGLGLLRKILKDCGIKPEQLQDLL